MKRLFRILKNFRQEHLFVFPKEARAAIVIARQLSVEELEQERKRYQDAANALISCKIHHRRSTHCYKVEFQVDKEVLSGNSIGVRAIADNIAANILWKHEQQNRVKN